VQKINNYNIQSEQLNNNGRIPESNKSIRLLCIRAGSSCLRIILPTLISGILLSGCFGATIGNLGPLQIKQSDLITTPSKIIIAQNKKEKN